MKLNLKRLIAAAISSAMLFTSFSYQAAADENIPETGETVILADEAESNITVKSGGWKESMWAEWLPVQGAAEYKVYVKKTSEDDSAYTAIDDELIRQYPKYWRADAVGLAAGEYDLKVSAIGVDGTEIAWSKQKGIEVREYIRDGFAWSQKSTFKGSGAYKPDGTLKDGAQVIYITAKNAKTVTADILQNDKGTTLKCTGFQGIITGLQKKVSNRPPTVVRIIGTISGTINKDNVLVGDMDSFGSSAEGLQIKGASSYSDLNLTIEGIGNDATINGFGMLLRNAGNVELRNFGIINFMDDGVSIDTDNCNLWVHNLDIFYGSAGSDSDQAKGDGSLDNKGISTYNTFDEIHFWDSGKCSLCGMGPDPYAEYYVTYARNWFDHSDSRHPRIRGGRIHVYNNYFDGNSKYGVGMTTGGSAFVENNYFRNVNDPMMVSMQGTDASGDGTFSGEDGGYIKEYGNILSGTFKFISGEDAYCASSRDEQVPNTYVAKSVNAGVRYTNFDTSADMYDYTPIAANNVPSYVVNNAGRMNRGDLNWNFDNSVEDKNYGIISQLKSNVVNYKPKLVKVGGKVTKVTIADKDNVASSLNGVDGYDNPYKPVEKLKALNLPDKTEESKITAGNPANLESGALPETTNYAIKVDKSNIKSNADIKTEQSFKGSTGEITLIPTNDGKKTSNGNDVILQLDTSKGIRLAGTGDKNNRAIKFTTTDKGVLYISAETNSSKAPNRLLAVEGANGVITNAEFKTPLSNAAVELPAAGTYYIYSKDSGINITSLGVQEGEVKIPDKPVYDNTPGFTYTAVEPATAEEYAEFSQPKSIENSSGALPDPIDPPIGDDDVTDPDNPDNPNKPSNIPHYGDLNLDGVITIEDVSLILQYVLNGDAFIDKIDSDPDINFIFNPSLAKISNNKNGVSAADASLVLQKVLNSKFSFPEGKEWINSSGGETSSGGGETSSGGGETSSPSGEPVSSGEWTANETSLPGWLTIEGGAQGSKSNSYNVFTTTDSSVNDINKVYSLAANKTMSINLAQAANVKVYISGNNNTANKGTVSATLDGTAIGSSYSLPGRKDPSATPFEIKTDKGGLLKLTTTYNSLVLKVVVSPVE